MTASVRRSRRRGDEAGVKRCECPMTSPFTTYRFGRFEVRTAQRSVLADGNPVPLGARAFDVLVALIERRDRVVGGDELFERVWPGLVVEENNLRQQVAALRKLLGADAVATVPGRGYRFALPVAADETGGGEPAASPAKVPPAAGNLPLNLPPLIGRESELASVAALMAGVPLLTLVGAGGVGKTRLALAVADQVKDAFRDGVWLVELAPVADPSLLTRVVAGALAIHEEPGRPLLDTLHDFLRHAQLLIVLDNCEHLVEACAHWTQGVLQASAATRVLATSREALGIGGEQVWRVPSLRTAHPDADIPYEQLMGYAATRLFVERAAAASPAFRLTPANAAAVAQVCHQLDGIPLALELAAARVKAMRIEQVAERLRDRFALLTRGSRTALARHQTLRSLIDWSHDLLSEPERLLLRRLSVFAGGWTLEAAEAVCGGEGLAAADVMELLAQLAEKSLVAVDEQAAEPRYRMLETIRQYGLEKLDAGGENDAVRTRHLRHLVDFAEGIRTRLSGQDQLLWHGRAEAELDNLRAGLNWSMRPGHAGLGLRLINALHRFWYKNMHWSEIVGWQERLARQGEPPDAHLARSFYVAGMLATNFHPQTGRRLCEEGLSLSRSLAFDEGIAWALMWIGHIDTRKRDPATAQLFTEASQVAHRIEDPWRRAFLLSNSLICQANYEAFMGRDDSAQALVRACEEQIALIGNDAIYIGHCRALMATMAVRRGDVEGAARLVAESLALHRAVDSKFDVAAGLAQQGMLALTQGEPARALLLFKESLPLHRNHPTSQWVTKGLAHLLIAYCACGQWWVAARLAGALCSAGGAPDASPPELSGRVARAYEEAVGNAREALGARAFDDEAGAGRGMTREQAIALALAC